MNSRANSAGLRPGTMSLLFFVLVMKRSAPDAAGLRQRVDIHRNSSGAVYAASPEGGFSREFVRSRLHGFPVDRSFGKIRLPPLFRRSADSRSRMQYCLKK